MSIKLKICGVGNLADAIALDNMDGVDYIGMINDPSSPRFVPDIEILKTLNFIKKPLVSVKVNGSIANMVRFPTKFVQIHRVLRKEELEELSTIGDRNVILYVPASLEYVYYLKEVQKYTDYILIDSPKKGIKVNKEVVKKLLDLHPDAGVGGGITPYNIEDFVQLNPGWIDVSSGVEFYPGKKDLSKVRKLVEVIKHG